MKKVFFQTVMVAFLALLFSLPVQAEIPRMINFEGILRDLNGNAVPDGSYRVTFSIYNSISGGTALWTETWSGSTSPIATKEGMFSVQLGTHNPFDVDFFANNPNTFLGIQVGMDPEMVPRQRITSVAYAFTAGSGGIPSGGIIMWSGSTTNIPDGWALCDGLNGTPDLRNRFIVGAGTNYSPNDTGGTDSISISHEHGITSQTLSGTGGNHYHPVNIRTGAVVRGDYDYDKDVRDGDDKNAASNHHVHDVQGNTGYSGNFPISVNAHSHGGATGPALTAPVDIRPMYYALCFIIKM